MIEPPVDSGAQSNPSLVDRHATTRPPSPPIPPTPNSPSSRLPCTPLLPVPVLVFIFTPLPPFSPCPFFLHRLLSTPFLPFPPLAFIPTPFPSLSSPVTPYPPLPLTVSSLPNHNQRYHYLLHSLTKSSPLFKVIHYQDHYYHLHHPLPTTSTFYTTAHHPQIPPPLQPIPCHSPTLNPLPPPSLPSAMTPPVL